MNNIISIDLDILMSPFVGVYNERVREHSDREKNWQRINEELLSSKYYHVNQEYLEKVKEILDKYSKQVDRIYVGYDHSSILDAINLERLKLTTPFKFNIYNFDYHHDIGYSEEQYEKITYYNTTDCGCWLGYLNYHNFINKYVWYYGVGSYYNEKKIGNDIKPKQFQMIPFEEYQELPIKADILYVTFSYPWIPPQIDKELINLMEPYENKIYYLEQQFNINGDQKNFLDV